MNEQMKQFIHDIPGVFQECEDSLIWYLSDNNLDIDIAKQEFIKYIDKWFNDYKASKEDEE